MTRRELLTGSASLVALTSANRALGSVAHRLGGAQAVRLLVDTRRTLGTIPPDFMGLGYEISSVARRGLLSAQNRSYVRLVRTLGPGGIIRVGGNTSDFSSFARAGKSVSTPKGTVVNSANLQELSSFLEATGWSLIWGLNLGSGDEREAVEEAQAVFASAGNKLLAFEIGNEPDLFGRGTAHRGKNYSYEDYLEEYRRYKSAVRAKLPDAPFAGDQMRLTPQTGSLASLRTKERT
jgi:hypothetical protein